MYICAQLHSMCNTCAGMKLFLTIFIVCILFLDNQSYPKDVKKESSHFIKSNCKKSVEPNKTMVSSSYFDKPSQCKPIKLGNNVASTPCEELRSCSVSKSNVDLSAKNLGKL